MSTLDIPFKLTAAGIDAAFNLGALSLSVTHVQIGSGNRTPNGSEVALVSPQESALITSHWEVSVGQHRIAAVIPASASSYDITEIGLWSGAPGGGGSVLVFYWSQGSGRITVKSPGVDFNFENDMFFGGVVPSNITIVADTQFNALSMLAAHNADSNAHPAIVTPPQFDNDASPVNSEFVQRALGNRRGQSAAIVGATTLTAANHAGRTLQISGSGPYTVTLPLASTCASGVQIEILVTGTGTFTISRQGTDQIYFAMNSPATSFTMQAGDTALLENTGGIWSIVEGSVLMKSFPQFLASLTASGYQKLPSGLILQWGTTTATTTGAAITYPITFPSGIPPFFGACVNAVAAPTQYVGSNSTSSGLTIYVNTGTAGVRWFAIGY